MAENQTPMTETNNTNELAVRREKLAALTAAGKNPFELTTFDVNAHSEAIKADFDAYEGKDVPLDLDMKLKAIERICELMRSHGRTVEEYYY